MSLHSLSVVFRVRILAAMAIVVAVILCSLHFWGDYRLSQEISTQANYARSADMVKDIENGTLQMRRKEKDFFLRKDLKYVTEYNVEKEKVLKLLTSLSGQPGIGSIERNIKNIEKGVSGHGTQFQIVSDLFVKMGLDEKQGHKGDLRKAVHNVEENLKAFKNDPLTIKMLMMRRHEKDFMLRGDEKYIARLSERRTEFDALLKEATFSEDEKKAITSLMNSYAGGFQSFADAQLKLDQETGKLSQIFSDMIPDMDAVLAFSQTKKSESEQTLARVRDFVKQVTIYFSGAMFLAIIVLAYFIGRSITSPIGILTSVMQKLAKGNTEQIIPNSEDKNEIGEMARAVEFFKANLIKNRELELERVEQEKRAELEKRETLNKLADDFEASLREIIESVSAASTELNSTAQALASASEETSSQVTSVSAASQQASTNVEAVASATEEMSASISEISTQVGEASKISRQAASDVETTAVQMATLAQTADKIGEIISMISEIAEQTNLLALNATIESARAGDAGKGFAIVASEVKALANETAKATEGISEFITQIQNETKSAVVAIGNIGKVISSLEETSTLIASTMEEQGAATREITRSLSEAAKGAVEVTHSIVNVEQASGEISAASVQVYSSSSELSKNSTIMKDRIDGFLRTVRAA